MKMTINMKEKVLHIPPYIFKFLAQSKNHQEYKYHCFARADGSFFCSIDEKFIDKNPSDKYHGFMQKGIWHMPGGVSYH